MLLGAAPYAGRAGTSHYASGSSSGVPSLARKPNYDFEKRRKEQDRKAKKDAKREDRLRRRSEGLPEDGEPNDEGTTTTPTEPAES